MPIVVPVGTGTSVGTGIVTYSGLVGSIGDWLNRSDLDSKIPDFIALCEERLNRLLRSLDMETTVTLSTTGETIDLPTDFLEARALYLNTDPRAELQAVSLGTLRTKYAQQITGQPEVYALSGGSIVFGPAPDAEYDAVLTYYQKLDPISSDNETNWLIASHPSLYLWGSLVMAEAFIWDDDRIPLWKNAWDEAISEFMGFANKKRYGGPLRLRASVSE
jgi:hypothetical protein